MVQRRLSKATSVCSTALVRVEISWAVASATGEMRSGYDECERRLERKVFAERHHTFTSVGTADSWLPVSITVSKPSIRVRREDGLPSVLAK